MNEMIDLDKLNVDESPLVRIRGKSLKVPPLTLGVYLRAVALDAENELPTRLQKQHELTREIISGANPGILDDQFWAQLSIAVMKRLFFAILGRWDQLEKKEETGPGGGITSPPPNGLTSAPSSSSSPNGSAGLPAKSEP